MKKSTRSLAFTLTIALLMSIFASLSLPVSAVVMDLKDFGSLLQTSNHANWKASIGSPAMTWSENNELTVNLSEGTGIYYDQEYANFDFAFKMKFNAGATFMPTYGNGLEIGLMGDGVANATDDLLLWFMDTGENILDPYDTAWHKAGDPLMLDAAGDINIYDGSFHNYFIKVALSATDASKYDVTYKIDNNSAIIGQVAKVPSMNGKLSFSAFLPGINQNITLAAIPATDLVDFEAVMGTDTRDNWKVSAGTPSMSWSDNKELTVGLVSGSSIYYDMAYSNMDFSFKMKFNEGTTFMDSYGNGLVIGLKGDGIIDATDDLALWFMDTGLNIMDPYDSTWHKAGDSLQLDAKGTTNIYDGQFHIYQIKIMPSTTNSSLYDVTYRIDNNAIITGTVAKVPSLNGKIAFSSMLPGINQYITIAPVYPSDTAPVIVEDTDILEEGKEIKLTTTSDILPEGTLLLIDKLEKDAALNSMFPSTEFKDYVAFDAAIETGVIPVDKTVTLTIDVPTRMMISDTIVYLINEDGTKVAINSTIKDDKLVIIIPSFATYAIAEIIISGPDSLIDFESTLNSGLWKDGAGNQLSVVNGEIIMKVDTEFGTGFYLDNKYKNFDFEFEMKGIQGEESPWYGAMGLRDTNPMTLWPEDNGDTAAMNLYMNLPAPNKIIYGPRKNSADQAPLDMTVSPFIDGNWHKVGMKLIDSSETQIRFSLMIDDIVLIDNQAFDKTSLEGYLSFLIVSGGSTFSLRNVGGNGPSFTPVVDTDITPTITTTENPEDNGNAPTGDNGFGRISALLLASIALTVIISRKKISAK